MCLHLKVRQVGPIYVTTQNIIDIKFVTRLRLGLSHIQEQEFKYSFQDTLNALFICEMDVKYWIHFPLQCLLFVKERCTLLSTPNKIGLQIPKLKLSNMNNILPFRNPSYSDKIKYQKSFNISYQQKYLICFFLSQIYCNSTYSSLHFL